MNRAIGFGLVLLAASSIAAAQSNAAFAGNPYLLASAGGGSHAAPGYLGVDLRDIGEDQVSALKLKSVHGAEIVLVDHDAPAGKAGLREHDVVLQMNGQTIESGDQIRRMLHDSPPGKTVVLVISRDGQQMTITTTMANREEVERRAWEQHITVPEPQDAPAFAADTPSAPSAAPAPTVPGNSFIGTVLMSPSSTGAMLEQMSKQLAQFFGVPGGSGVLVRSVAENSPAALAGMHAGDVLIRADARAIGNIGDWSKALKSSHGKPLSITVLRDKKEQTLTLTPDGKHRSSLDQPSEPSDSPVVARLGMSRVTPRP